MDGRLGGPSLARRAPQVGQGPGVIRGQMVTRRSVRPRHVLMARALLDAQGTGNGQTGEGQVRDVDVPRVFREAAEVGVPATGRSVIPIVEIVRPVRGLDRHVPRTAGVPGPVAAQTLELGVVKVGCPLVVSVHAG